MNTVGSTIPVRRRPYPGLLRIPHAGSIPIQACLTDKLEIAVAGTIEFEQRDHLDDAVQTISNSYNTDRARPDRVLNAPSGRARNKNTINGRDWLFGGDLQHGRTLEFVRHVTLNLTLNPSRFAEHCRREFNPSSFEDLPDDPATLLRRRDQHTTAARLTTLDGNDNQIGVSRWLSFLSRQWPEFIERYVFAVCELVSRDFNQHASNEPTSRPPVLTFNPRNPDTINFGYVEQYVEFQVEGDVRQAYCEFERVITEAGVGIRVTDSTRPLVSGREGSARWIETPLRQGVNLKVYAKSVDRLRVEVEYHGPSSRNAGGSMSQLVHAENWRARRSLGEKIAGLRQDAVQRIQALTELHARDRSSALDRPSDLMLELIVQLRALREPRVQGGGGFTNQDVRAFLAELFADGAVGGLEASPTRRIAEALMRKGLFDAVGIAERNPVRRYRPASGLCTAVDAVRAATSASRIEAGSRNPDDCEGES